MNPASANSSGRIEWLDYVKGIGIILVVFAHVVRGLRFDMVGDRLYDYQTIDPWIYSFHMPLFFFVSGFLFSGRSFPTWQHFLRAMVIGIVVPYVVWTVAFVGLQRVALSQVNNPYDLQRLLHIWRYPIGHMWFLYALFFVQIMFYSASRLFHAPGLIVLGGVFVLAYLAPNLGGWANAYVPGVVMGGTFFTVGLLVAARGLVPKSFFQSGIVALIAAAVWIGAMVMLRNAVAPRVAAPVGALSGVVMTVATCTLLPNVRGPVTATLAQLGQASIAIFVAHTIFGAGFRITLYRVGVFDCDFHVFAGTLVGLIVPLVLFILANRYEIGPYVGFGRAQKLPYVARMSKAVRSGG
jgi:fucose 4-O-acetylase-like acetyltransferase